MFVLHAWLASLETPANSHQQPKRAFCKRYLVGVVGAGYEEEDPCEGVLRRVRDLPGFGA